MQAGASGPLDVRATRLTGGHGRVCARCEPRCANGARLHIQGVHSHGWSANVEVAIRISSCWTYL